MNYLIIEEFKKLITYYRIEQIITNNNIIQYKIRTAQNLIDIVKNINYEINIDNVDDLKKYDGISDKTITKIKHIIKYGFIHIVSKYKEINNLYSILNRSGISDRKLFNIIEKYKINNIDDIKQLIKNKTIILPHMTLKYIEYSDKVTLKLSYDFIAQYELYLKKHIKNVIIAGSYRRGEKYSRDVDILIYSDNHTLKQLIKNINIVESLTTLTDNSVKYMCFCCFNDLIFKCDFRLFKRNELITSLFYFTGPKMKNINVRKEFKKYGYRLNEHNLLDNNGNVVELKKENDIYIILEKLKNK